MYKTTLLQISQLGHPVLRMKTHDITHIHNRKFQEFLEAMTATMLDADGVGIAANQVYQPFRAFIVASRPNPRYPKAPYMKPLAVINPILTTITTETTKDWEGCLSIPGIRALVPRFTAIKVTYTTRSGKRIEQAYSGFVARIFQHEYDHINGLVYLDKLETAKDIISEKEFRKIYLHKKSSKK